MQDDAPPLAVWAYFAILFASVVLLFLSYSYLGFGPYARILKCSHICLEDALIELNAGDTSAISIVILGSSLTERALISPAEIEDRIFKETRRKVNILRVALYDLNMDLADRIDFFGHIKRHPPRYLFLENFSVNLDHDNSDISIPIPIDVAFFDIRNRIRKMVGLVPHENYFEKWYTFDSKPLPGSDFYSDKFDSATFSLLQTKRMVVREVSQNGTATSAYDKLMKGNTKVIFLDMPQSEKLRHNFLDESSAAELNKVLEFYNNQYNTDYWQYPEVMPDSCFMDGAHLNSRGAMKYQDWFVSELSSLK